MPAKRRLTLISWNVNGIRAASKKGFFDWLAKAKPDIVGIQETRAAVDQLDTSTLNPKGYSSYWVSGERKGYCGVGIYSRTEPATVVKAFEDPVYDCEGRFIAAEYSEFVFINGYFPNGGMGDHRVKYKLEFYDTVLAYAAKLRKKGKRVIISGDFNTAHHPIDLANPEKMERVSGFLPVERAGLEKFFAAGYVDTFREFEKGGGHYTWWDQRIRARERNEGWRIDYHMISPDLRPHLEKAFILPEVTGSDHCPVGITLQF